MSDPWLERETPNHPRQFVDLDVCAVADVPLGEGRAVTVEGRRIAIFNSSTGWYALDHRCRTAASRWRTGSSPTHA